MKTRLFIFLLALLSCIACKKETPVENPLPELPINEAPDPVAHMTIVKFADKEQLDYVIVQHPLYGHDGYEDVFVYDEDTTLMLNRSLPNHQQLKNVTSCSLDSFRVEFLQNELSVSGMSPYIPLTDDYYLIDWRWMELMPLSGTTNITPHTADYYAHIRKHLFITETKWSALDDLFKEWDKDQVSPSINLSEIHHVSYESIDYNYLGCYDKDKWYPYPSVYYGGTYIPYAYLYYQQDKGSEKWRVGTFEGYCAFLDSVQNSYVQTLIEIIQNKQLQDFSYEYKFN